MEKTINCMFERRLLSVHRKSKSNVFLHWAVFHFTQLQNVRMSATFSNAMATCRWMWSQSVMQVETHEHHQVEGDIFKAFYFLIKTKKTTNFTGIQAEGPMSASLAPTPWPYPSRLLTSYCETGDYYVFQATYSPCRPVWLWNCDLPILVLN